MGCLLQTHTLLLPSLRGPRSVSAGSSHCPLVPGYSWRDITASRAQAHDLAGQAADVGLICSVLKVLCLEFGGAEQQVVRRRRVI